MRIAITLIIGFMIGVFYLLLSIYFTAHIAFICSIFFIFCWLLMVIYLGDKWIAEKIKASKENFPADIQNWGINLKYRMNMERVSLYVTKEYYKNIYVFQTMNKRPILVIGEQILSVLSKREREALVHLFFYLVDKNKIRDYTWFNLFLLFFEWPKVAIHSWGIDKENWFARCIYFYLFPLEYFRFLVSEKDFEKRLDKMDEALSRYYGSELLSLFSKIKSINMSDILDRPKTNSFFENFSIVSCQRLGVLGKMVFNDCGVSSRFL